MNDGFDRRFLDEVHAAVPEIGEGRRWYDAPYRLLSEFYRSRVGRKLPSRVREKLLYYINYLVPYFEHDRHKAWSREDPSHNLRVPQEEHVSIPSLWVVEVFPPSQYESLGESIRRNAWDKRRVQYGMGEANLDTLERSRSGKGMLWWRLGEVNRAGASYRRYLDGRTERLDESFDAVRLDAVQIGSGLTAVLAHFSLSSSGASSVDSVWHSQHEPRLLKGKGRPRSEDRLFASYRRTQEARRLLHEAARAWVSDAFPGAFKVAGAPQPLLDLLLMEKHDPSLGEQVGREYSDALRALGVDGGPAYLRASDELPGLLLDHARESIVPGLDGGRNTFALWGNFNSIADRIPHLSAYGGNRDGTALGYYLHGRLRNFIALLAIGNFLELFEISYSDLRDRARLQHGRISIKNLRKLRSVFLTLSLDLGSAVRDLKSFHHPRVRDELEFTENDANWIQELDRQAGRPPRGPESLNDSLRRGQTKTAERLLAIDKEYRELLSTVASLGSSVDASRLGRIALWVSLTSLLVSLVALSIAELGDKSILELIWRKIGA